MTSNSLESDVARTFCHTMIMDGEFRIEECVQGVGGQSFIFQAFSTSSPEKFYLKIIDPRVGQLRIEHELLMANEMTHLDSPYLVPCVRTTGLSIPFGDSRAETAALMMPAFTNGDLFNRVLGSRPASHPSRCGLDEFEIRILGCDMIQSLIAMHEHRFVHNDVKPENFLLTPRNGQERVALCDYGLVMKLEEDGFVYGNPAYVGTPAYRAPEIVRREKRWTAAVDLWALGCTFFLMFTGEMAFTGTATARILNGEPNAVIGELKPSQQFADLLRKLICVDQHVRITAHEAAGHPFFGETGNIKLSLKLVLQEEDDSWDGSV
jgi:serine/threonine protein kinase